MNKRDTSLGVLVGAVTGAVTALLFAKKPGKEVRSNIKESGVKTKEMASVKSSQLKQKISDEVKNTKNVLRLDRAQAEANADSQAETNADSQVEDSEETAQPDSQAQASN